MRKTFYSLAIACMALTAQAQIIVSTFEDLPLEPESIWNGSDGTGAFASGDYTFMNAYNAEWGSFSGFGYTNSTSTAFSGYTDQFNSIVGHGVHGSATYALFYYSSWDAVSPVINTNGEAKVISGFYITNNAYVYTALTNGYTPARKFGQGDWFKVTATGKDADDQVTGTADFYLADFRSENEADHYIVNTWQWFDLSSLGEVVSVEFTMSSSDNGEWGINTPTYFLMDDFNGVAPFEVADFENLEMGSEGHISVSTEDDDDRTEFQSGGFEFASGCMSDYDSWWFYGYANSTETKFESLDDQWNNIVGGGHNGSANYGVAYVPGFYGPAYVTVLGTEEGEVIPGFYVTNSSYTYTSITNGDAYAKKFGKGDWYKLTITGYDANDQETGTKEFMLADFTAEDASKWYIIKDWRYVSLRGLGTVKKIKMEVTSTDNGDWGMNTPAYFCFDDFGAEGVESIPEGNVPTGIAQPEIVNRQSVNRKSFDLQGRRINSQLKKGLYIIGGRKTIVK